jgi:hypothetical protein
MTDDEKKAGIDAEYLPVIRELIAKQDPLANFAALLVASASRVSRQRQLQLKK